MPENPRPNKGQRHLDCEHYSGCLAYVAKEHWRDFNCESCEYSKHYPKEKPKVTEMESKRLCKRCNERETTNPISHYCSSCLHEMKKEKAAKQKTAKENTQKATGTSGKKKKVSDKRKPGRPQKSANTAITIEFGKYASILDEIKSLAEEEIRPLDLQIIYMLNNHLKARS